MLLNEATSDWLGSKNYYYNTRLDKISDNINEVIDYSNLSFHPEGLNNYLRYGYSVYGQTPIEDVKRLEANMHVYKDTSGRAVVEQLRDPFDDLMGIPSSALDTLEYLHYIINSFVNTCTEQIIVPSSGGFDSRLINTMIDNKSLVHAYTYGISENQSESFEVVYASRLCEILGIKWKQIELGNFHNLIDEWEEMFGVSTHTHGMYQMEFYQQISELENGGVVISGILGDVWAGKVRVNEIDSIDKLTYLGLTHGVDAYDAPCKIPNDNTLQKRYFEKNKEKLKDENWRILEMCRRKSVLLSYLLRVPEHYNFSVWSPFLDIEAIARILNLSWDEKNKRKWQVDYFRNKEVLIGEMNLKCVWLNCLNGYACLEKPLIPLNVKLLSQLFNKEYIEKINEVIKYISNDYLAYSTSEEISWYSKYMILHPIQKVLEKAQNG